MSVVDFVSKRTRSRYMAAVKPRGNLSTERLMERLLREHKVCGWRKQQAIPGTPDFCWKRERVALFVDGCFWHGCPNCYKLPKSRVRYWAEKVSQNRRRDRRVNSKLRTSGWTVIRVWECKIKSRHTIARIISRLSQFANGKTA